MVIYYHESAPFSAERGKGKNARTVWYRTVKYITNKGKKNEVDRRVKARNKDQYFAKSMKNMTIVDEHTYTKRIHRADGTVEEKTVSRPANYKKHGHSKKK